MDCRLRLGRERVPLGVDPPDCRALGPWDPGVLGGLGGQAPGRAVGGAEHKAAAGQDAADERLVQGPDGAAGSAGPADHRPCRCHAPGGPAELPVLQRAAGFCHRQRVFHPRGHLDHGGGAQLGVVLGPDQVDVPLHRPLQRPGRGLSGVGALPGVVQRARPAVAVPGGLVPALCGGDTSVPVPAGCRDTAVHDRGHCDHSQGRGRRLWLLGRYRSRDDVLFCLEALGCRPGAEGHRRAFRE
mmetsp:Transcript_96593/g.288359  ORF Transcript_96593/g.288359 Transcript_96593/m.288359 type:complete len:242 (-) Transcript_96593:902-1627(-)